MRWFIRGGLSGDAVASWLELLPRFEVLLALCLFSFDSAADHFSFQPTTPSAATPPTPQIPQIPARPPIAPSQDRRFPCFRSVFLLQIGVVYLVAAVASCFELLPRFEVLLALCFFCFESAANRFLLRQRRYRRHTTPPPPGNRRGSCGREGPPPPRCWAARAGRRRQPRQRRKRRWRREVHRFPLHDGDQDAARVSAGAPAGNAGGGGGRGVRLVPSRLVSRSVL